MLEELLEIRLRESDDFLKVRETLTRIGVASRKTSTLYQSCHILHKNGRYFIAHFKELFRLDGKDSLLSENDQHRRNTIAKLLQDWGMITILDPNSHGTLAPLSQIKILSHREKVEWVLLSKYTLGK